MLISIFCFIVINKKLLIVYVCFLFLFVSFHINIQYIHVFEVIHFDKYLTQWFFFFFFLRLNQSEFEDSNPSESQQSGSESASQPSAEGSSMPESYSSYTSDYTYSRPSQSYDTTPFSSGFSDSGPVNIRGDISQGTATLAQNNMYNCIDVYK